MTFALTFKTKLNETFTTAPILFGPVDTAPNRDALAQRIDDALVQLPNRVIDSVTVSIGDYDISGPAPYYITVDVVFDGDYVQGAQNLLVVEDYECGAGCTPRITGLHGLVWDMQVVKETVKSDYNSFECGRRGKCDYDTGVCQCFAGFTGPSCNACTAMI